MAASAARSTLLDARCCGLRREPGRRGLLRGRLELLGAVGETLVVGAQPCGEIGQTAVRRRGGRVGRDRGTAPAALRAISACSMPVATTETRMTPSRFSSKVAPTMMLASWSTSSRMRVAASSTSNRVRSLPPVIEINRPRAPFIEQVVDQRVGDRSFGRGQRALLAGGFAGAHHRLAHLTHHGADVGEVEVDQAFLDHQIGDAGDARIEHLVGHREGVGEGGLFVGDPEQVLVRDDQERVDHLVQFGNA